MLLNVIPSLFLQLDNDQYVNSNYQRILCFIFSLTITSITLYAFIKSIKEKNYIITTIYLVIVLKFIFLIQFKVQISRYVVICYPLFLIIIFYVLENKLGIILAATFNIYLIFILIVRLICSSTSIDNKKVSEYVLEYHNDLPIFSETTRIPYFMYNKRIYYDIEMLVQKEPATFLIYL